MIRTRCRRSAGITAESTGFQSDASPACAAAAEPAPESADTATEAAHGSHHPLWASLLERLLGSLEVSFELRQHRAGEFIGVA